MLIDSIHSLLKHRLQLIMKNDNCKLLLQIGVTLITIAFALIAFSFAIADEKGAAKDRAGRRDEPGKNTGKRDEGGKKPEGDGDKRVAPDRNNTKEGKVFKAYDKNHDSFVDDEEMGSMREGKLNSRGRREIRKSIKRADQDHDGKLNIKEFIWWYTKGRLDERAENPG